MKWYFVIKYYFRENAYFRCIAETRLNLIHLLYNARSYLHFQLSDNLNEPGHEKMGLMPYANNKDADQPAHPRSLISVFVAHCLCSTMPLVSISKISSLWLACVAEQAGLCLTWSETPKDTLSHDMAQIIQNYSVYIINTLNFDE